jgi:hypothetical protein
VAHWADGDLLIGDTLVDVKTVIRADPASKVAVWLWQLLGYAWLDSIGDRYRIRGTRARAHERLRSSLADHCTDQGVLYDSAAWLVHARRS